MSQQPVYSYPSGTQETYAAQSEQQNSTYAPAQQVSYAQAPATYQVPQTTAYGYSQAPPAYYTPTPNPDEVRTVFITGFPQDLQKRELTNLLRFIPGYEACQLNWKGDFAQGFALFNSGQAAFTACQMLNNVAFDDDVIIRCEMARKNMYIKNDATKRARTEGYYGVGMGPSKDNPPCSTLFVGNLGDQVSEQELMNLFSSQPGFVTLKVVRNARSATAFVEFSDLASAMAVHDAQQGAMLQSSDRGGVRIQYSKNPFGKKRDHQGNPVDPSTLPPNNSDLYPTLTEEQILALPDPPSAQPQ